MENQYIRVCELGVSHKGFLFVVFLGGNGKWYSSFPCRPGFEGSSSGLPCETKEEALLQGADAVNTFPIPEMLVTVDISAHQKPLEV